MTTPTEPAGQPTPRPGDAGRREALKRFGDAAPHTQNTQPGRPGHADPTRKR
jgi:hypothetical protein